MYIDKDLELTSGTAKDLGVDRPGPGNPIKLFAQGVGGNVTVTTGATNAAADALITVDATNDVEFELPSGTKRWIKATFAAGSVNFVDTAQTAE